MRVVGGQTFQHKTGVIQGPGGSPDLLMIKRKDATTPQHTLACAKIDMRARFIVERWQGIRYGAKTGCNSKLFQEARINKSEPQHLQRYCAAWAEINYPPSPYSIGMFIPKIPNKL